MNDSGLKETIDQQKTVLKDLLGLSLLRLADDLTSLLKDKERLNERLAESCHELPYCKNLFALDVDGTQVSATLNKDLIDYDSIGNNRADRPYMLNMFDGKDFQLSDAYISQNKKRPSITAIQVIRDESNQRVGFLGVDYDLRHLPRTEDLYEEPAQWRQIKGDPSIRGGLFLQERTESVLDKHFDDVMYLMEELMLEHGVYHCQIHFSSSRATIWHVDNPFVYRILPTDDLLDPNICLAYPHSPYFDKATVPSLDIMHIFDKFKQLRFMDDTIYLRSGSLNLVNGMIGLNFSCDGSHYLTYDEFQNKGMDFWLP